MNNNTNISRIDSKHLNIKIGQSRYFTRFTIFNRIQTSPFNLLFRTIGIHLTTRQYDSTLPMVWRSISLTLAHRYHHRPILETNMLVHNLNSHLESDSTWRYALLLMPLTCLGLGFWQLYRLKWKLGLIQAQKEALKKQPIPLVIDIQSDQREKNTTPKMDRDLDRVFDEDTSSSNTTERSISWIQAIQDILHGTQPEFQPYLFHGQLDNQHEYHLMPRTYRGESGLHLISPLHLSNGYKILVNRGWIPMSQIEQDLPQNIGSSLQPVEVIGYFQKPQVNQKNKKEMKASVHEEKELDWDWFQYPKPYFAVDNNIQANQWHWLDTNTIAKITGSIPILIYALDIKLTSINGNEKNKNYNDGDDREMKSSTSRDPIGKVHMRPLNNPHLNYAITWVTLALFLGYMSLRMISHRYKVINSPLISQSLKINGPRQWIRKNQSIHHPKKKTD